MLSNVLLKISILCFTSSIIASIIILQSVSVRASTQLELTCENVYTYSLLSMLSLVPSVLSLSAYLSLIESFLLCQRNVCRNNLRYLRISAVQNHFNSTSGTKIFWVTLTTQRRVVMYSFSLLLTLSKYSAQRIY